MREFGAILEGHLEGCRIHGAELQSAFLADGPHVRKGRPTGWVTNRCLMVGRFVPKPPKASSRGTCHRRNPGTKNAPFPTPLRLGFGLLFHGFLLGFIFVENLGKIWGGTLRRVMISFVNLGIL